MKRWTKLVRHCQNEADGEYHHQTKEGKYASKGRPIIAFVSRSELPSHNQLYKKLQLNLLKGFDFITS